MSMFSSNRSFISGGTFNQTVNNFDAQSRLSQVSLDRLHAAGAPAALHNSAERFDPPRCHPNTRVAVMDELTDWVMRRGDGGYARVLWLSGPAGAGKSAIAQSLCELCTSHKFLLASFFFNRSNASRNNSKRLVATITSQIYKMVPRQYQSLILDVIENDPLVFDLSIEAQFKALIMDPLRNLFEDDHFNNYHAPRLIVIDGLDECSPRAAQVNILRAVQAISTQRSSPFIFLIASRPEHDIQMFFRSHSMGASFRQLDLDDFYLPDLDIEIFLRDKLQETRTTHPESIPQGWPASRIIEQLVQKSSGQFIYASVVVKFVTSDRHYPPDRLEIVLGLRPPRRDLPFAELDALYSHILSCVKDVNIVLQILRVVILFEDMHVNAYSPDLETLYNLDRGECRNALCDLQSVVQIRPRRQQICFLHKSLSDYLRESSRSHRYYIDTSPSMVVPLAIQCLRVMSDPMLGYHMQCVNFVLGRLMRVEDLLASNIQICHKDLMSFSVMKFRKHYRGSSEKAGIRQRTDSLLFSYFILNDLCALEGTEYEYVYHHYLRQYPELVRQYADVYGSWDLRRGYNFKVMIMIFVLLGYSQDYIFSEAFGASEPLLQSFSNLNAITGRAPTSLGNLSRAVARRCVNSLTNDRYSNSAAFALECLALTLPNSKLSADLNEACRSLKSLLGCSSGGRSLAYDFRGRSCAELGHTDAEMRKMTRVLEHEACTAMEKYMERYAKGGILDSN